MSSGLKLAIVLALAAFAGAARGAEPARLDLVMTPHATSGDDSYLGVRMTLAHPDLKAGAPLVHLPLTLVGIPTARYDGDALTARDDRGFVPLTQSEEPPTPQGVYRRWSVGRATIGDVTVSYHAPPRRISAATNNGPLFDLREEAGVAGFIGAGVGTMTPVAPWALSHPSDLGPEPGAGRIAGRLVAGRGRRRHGDRRRHPGVQLLRRGAGEGFPGDRTRAVRGLLAWRSALRGRGLRRARASSMR